MRFVGQGVTFTGVANVDNLRFARATAPTLQVLAPRPDTLSTAVDAPADIRATATPGEGRTITGVTWSSGSESGTLARDAASGEWRGGWNTWSGPEGVRTLRVTATDSEGEPGPRSPSPCSSATARLQVELVRREFDARLTAARSCRARAAR